MCTTDVGLLLRAQITPLLFLRTKTRSNQETVQWDNLEVEVRRTDEWVGTLQHSGIFNQYTSYKTLLFALGLCFYLFVNHLVRCFV